MALLNKVADEELATLKGKTIIITGGGSGIGKAAASLAYAAGANIAIADLSGDVEASLSQEFPERMIFVKADVSKWSEVLNVFKKTWDRFGAIEVVLSNAGTHAFETLQDETLDDDEDPTAPSLKSFEVNLHSAAYCTKAAVHFFKKQPQKKCQLIFTGSAASLIDTPPLTLYCAVNMVAPWMTVTPAMPDWIKEKWGELPTNDSVGVAKALLLPALRTDTNGKTLWVAGNDIVEIEDALHDAQPQWLGARLSADVDEGQLRLGIGA
ncbi:hypothetical protein G7Z17_g2413 [Cylindrodendrum hubeiense]|uniref:NAD(P)-binding protein n=1 Tax=Cylindrodendrum hubeiense TaxID=595255 RepID=A0A9P5HE88_9HYPO|nr:hypothetical protein G7Z17_g2413 [Cylindrodendrum hubeiense]